MSTATTSFWMLTDDDVQAMSGEYFIGKRKSRADSEAYDAQARAKLWEELERLTGAKYPTSA